MEKLIKLYPTQHKFVTCPDRFTGFIGGIGSGKTYSGAVKALKGTEEPGSLGLIIAPTYPMLRDATLRTFMDVANGAIANMHKGEMRIEMTNGSEILCRSADNPDRLRGPNIHWAWIDEAALCHAMTWDITIGRLRGGGRAGPCWNTSTPKGRNWLYAKSEQMQLFKAKTDDNPYLDPVFVDSLRAAYTGNFAAQELDAEFVSFEGLVYDHFYRDIHMQERAADEMAYWIAGVDEGYSNPAVILAIGVDSDGRLHVAEEYYERRKLQDQVVAAASEMMSRYDFLRLVVDSSAAGLIAAMVNANLPAQPHDGRVLDGISNVQNRLPAAGDGKPSITVSAYCPNTIAEFESYCWKETASGTKDEPEKINDHAMDALRYANDSVDGGLWWIS